MNQELTSSELPVLGAAELKQVVGGHHDWGYSRYRHRGYRRSRRLVGVDIDLIGVDVRVGGVRRRRSRFC